MHQRVCLATTKAIKHVRAHQTYIFDDHNQKRQFNAKSLLWVSRALNECGADIGTHNFKNGRLNIRISDTLDVAISNCMEEKAVGERHSKIH